MLQAFDTSARPVRQGDVVRVLRVPDLTGMSEEGRRECLPVFEHIVGTYKRVVRFDAQGLAELNSRIRSGPQRGFHTVWIETEHLRIRRVRSG